MAGKESATSSGAAPFFNEQQQRATNLQHELLESYEQSSRAWLERMQTEMSLWSDLATKLSTTRSIPDAIEAYTHCVSQQIQMSAEDGQRLVHDCQELTQKFAKSLSTGRPTAST